MKPINSAITTLQREASSAIGTPRGGLGLATLENSNPVASWLAKQKPADMDSAAVSRASQHGVGLKVRYELRFPSGPNGEYLPSYAVAVGCDIGGNPEGVALALADLRNFMTPAPVRSIEGWLAELSVIVARGKDDEFGDELRLSAYSGRLARYPADVVRSVLLEARYKFWPTWEELAKRCDALTSPRANMIAALERGMPEPEKARRAATEAEKARVQTLVDELFPSQSAEMRKAAVDEMMKGNCMTGAPDDAAGFKLKSFNEAAE